MTIVRKDKKPISLERYTQLSTQIASWQRELDLIEAQMKLDEKRLAELGCKDATEAHNKILALVKVLKAKEAKRDKALVAFSEKWGHLLGEK